MGLLVNQAQHGRCGTSNYANMAMRFFKNPSHSQQYYWIKWDTDQQMRSCTTDFTEQPYNKSRGIQRGKERAGLLVKLYPWYWVCVQS